MFWSLKWGERMIILLPFSGRSDGIRAPPTIRGMKQTGGRSRRIVTRDLNIPDLGPSFGFTASNEPLWDNYMQYLVVRKYSMDQETPSFVPPFQVRSYRHHRKQQMRAFDADQEQRRAKATRVYDAHERQRMEERTGKPGRRYIPMDDASWYVVYVERGHFTDIPIFVPRGLEKRYLDFRNLALHGFDEDQLQRRQRALWIFDEDERTMKARDQRTRDNHNPDFPLSLTRTTCPRACTAAPFPALTLLVMGL